MKLTKEIDSTLICILEYICKNPLIFVSETDIHSLVMRELMKISELQPEKLYPTRCTIGMNKFGQPSEETYKTMRIHKEYGHAELDRSRSDIVILNPNDIEDIVDPLNLKKGKKKTDWIVPDYIFEFGTEKAAGSEGEFKTHLNNDIIKANKSSEKGYVIHIQRNVCVSSGGRLLKNRAKYEGYLNVLKEEKKKAKQNVKILVFIIDIGTDGRVISKEGKIKLFNGIKFEGINQSMLKEKISNILK